MGLDSLDESIDNALQKHDAANGTDLAKTRQDANDLWTKMYATRELRDGLQGMMTAQPQSGARQIPGGGLQGVINKLDPAGGKEYRTPLQKLTNGDPQTLKDLHELADFAGKNQAKAGAGMAGMMAKFRMMSLPPAMLGLGMSPVPTLALLGSSGIMAQMLARPGIAKFMLGVLRAGSDATKGAAAFGELVHAISTSKPDQADSLEPTNTTHSAPQTSANTPSPSPNPGVQPATKSTAQTANPTKQASPISASLRTATMEPPAEDQGNATTQNRWVANAIEQAKGKNAQPADSGSKWVTAAVDRARASTAGPAQSSTPPASLWAGKENKRLILKNPSNGRPEKWSLHKGTPVRVD